jgi:hypothetical protein
MPNLEQLGGGILIGQHRDPREVNIRNGIVLGSQRKADTDAKDFLEKARQENLRNLFQGTELVWGKHARASVTANALLDGSLLAYNVKKLATDPKGVATSTISNIRDIPGQFSAIGKSGKAVVAGAKGAISGMHLPHGIPSEAALEHDAKDLLALAMSLPHSEVAAALGDIIEPIVKEVVPLFGLLYSSYKSVQSWRAVVSNARDLYKADYYLKGALPGDPLAAAEAVNVTIKRFLATNTADAVRNTASASAKVAGLFADLGTATTASIGAASALASLIQSLAIMGREYREMKAGNRRLKDPGTLDATVFSNCPVLGCYLLSCSDTFMVVNFLVKDMGSTDWMTNVEAMKKRLEPLIENATKAIVSSHLTLQGLQANKGTFEKKHHSGILGLIDRIKDNAKYQFGLATQSNATLAYRAAHWGYQANVAKGGASHISSNSNS